MLILWSAATPFPSPFPHHIIDWFTKPGQEPRKFDQAPYQFECGILTFLATQNTLHYRWQSHRGIVRGLPRTCKEWVSFWNNTDLCMLFSRHLNWNPNVFSSTFLFWFGTLFMKKKNQGIQNSKIVSNSH